jgi:hypothetical protein
MLINHSSNVVNLMGRYGKENIPTKSDVYAVGRQLWLEGIE